MFILKTIIYILIFLCASYVGILTSKRYEQRENELKEFKNALNILKVKMKFTYEPIPEIFKQIVCNTNESIGKVFISAIKIMENSTAGEAWDEAIDKEILNIKEEDKKVLKGLSKLLGKTNIEGQVSQIELTSNFLEEQIANAKKEREKNEKLYKSLGMIVGLTIVIIIM